MESYTSKVRGNTNTSVPLDEIPNPTIRGDKTISTISKSTVLEEVEYYKYSLIGKKSVESFKGITEVARRYSPTGSDPLIFYSSTSYWDEYLWGGAWMYYYFLLNSWMYYAIGNSSYLALVTTPGLAKHAGALWGGPNFGVLSWDNKLTGAQELLTDRAAEICLSHIHELVEQPNTKFQFILEKLEDDFGLAFSPTLSLSNNWLLLRFYLVNAIDIEHWYFLGDFLIWDLGHLYLNIFHLGSAILSLNVPLYAWPVVIDDLLITCAEVAVAREGKQGFDGATASDGPRYIYVDDDDDANLGVGLCVHEICIGRLSPSSIVEYIEHTPKRKKLNVMNLSRYFFILDNCSAIIDSDCADAHQFRLPFGIQDRGFGELELMFKQDDVLHPIAISMAERVVDERCESALGMTRQNFYFVPRGSFLCEGDALGHMKTRDQLELLMKYKTRRVALKGTSKMVKQKITEINTENGKYDVEIGEVDKSIREMQESIAKLIKKRESIVANMQKELDEYEESIQDLEHDFYKVVSSSW
ncbi:hypothetical protein GIB67_030840 [Kingdonia uniflora]|uniref:cellulase n=1 Tax=Kingdonia uniflora TaxID=39325 RepID=A0A7J7L367_9MAGN|nr:hypothetical protein GIB67_030840 [Kingdonia uniflora]